MVIDHRWERVEDLKIIVTVNFQRRRQAPVQTFRERRLGDHLDPWLEFEKEFSCEVYSGPFQAQSSDFSSLFNYNKSLRIAREEKRCYSWNKRPRLKAGRKES